MCSFCFPEPKTNSISKSVKIKKKKVSSSTRKTLAKVTSVPFQASFRKGLRLFRGRVSKNDLAKAIKKGDKAAIDKLIPWERLPDDMGEMKSDARNAFSKSAKLEEKGIPTVLKPEFRFDTENPRIAQWIEKNTGKNITALSKETRKGTLSLVKEVVKDVKDRGIPPGTASKRLIGNIGLNEPQAQALENFKSKLRAQGVSENSIARQAERKMQKQIRARAKMISRTESFNAVSSGQQEVWNQMADQDLIDPKKTLKEWITTIDDLTGDDHLEMDGKKVPVNEPWITPLGNSVMVPQEDRPNCFDDQTEVLTNKGWKYFEDVKLNHNILSVNLKTGGSKFVSIKKKIKYKVDEKLDIYKNKICNLVTTNDHMHVYSKNEANHGWILLNGSKIPKARGKFLCTIPNWDGENIKTIKIGKSEFNPELFVEFLGYYLSEGSISKPKTGSWQIKISQKKYKDTMLECTNKLFDKIWNGKEAIYIPLNDEAIISFFKKLGKSHKKYIPELIKKLSKNYIKIFLDAYILGDGHIRPGKVKMGYLFREERVYFTSSNKLASDIGELILKIGKRPSYTQRPIKTIKFKNGTYTMNRPVWVISENKSTNIFIGKCLKKDQIHYQGYVHDVELSKWHTLFVRRGGKVMLSGNCRCTMSIIPVLT